MAIGSKRVFVLGGEEPGRFNLLAGEIEGFAIIGRAAFANSVPRRPVRREHLLVDDLPHMCRGQGRQITRAAADLSLRHVRSDNEGVAESVAAPDLRRNPGADRAFRNKALKNSKSFLDEISFYGTVEQQA
jgi:hypothetical protein